MEEIEEFLTFSISKCGGLILNFWHFSAEVGNDVEKGAKLRICFDPQLSKCNLKKFAAFYIHSQFQLKDDINSKLVRHTLKSRTLGTPRSIECLQCAMSYVPYSHILFKNSLVNFQNSWFFVFIFCLAMPAIDCCP